MIASAEERLLLRVIRSYEAVYPPNPADLSMPHGAYMVRPAAQERLGRIMLETKVDGSCSWRRAFWKLVISHMETAISDSVHFLPGLGTGDRC